MGTEEGLRPRRVGVLVYVAAAAFVLDVITKVVMVAVLEGDEPIELAGDLLRLRVTRNSGAAFSIGSGVTVVFTLVAAGVVAYIVRTARRLRSVMWAVTLGLLLGGAAGNLVDRLMRAPGPLRGHVVDWIELPHWPVFNLADIAIVGGGAMAVVLAVRGIPMSGVEDATEHGRRPEHAGEAEHAEDARDVVEDDAANAAADTVVYPAVDPAQGGPAGAREAAGGAGGTTGSAAAARPAEDAAPGGEGTADAAAQMPRSGDDRAPDVTSGGQEADNRP